MSVLTSTRATIDDLYAFDGKAELVDGRLVPLMATGSFPNFIAALIWQSLYLHTKAIGQGSAYTDNMGFVVPELQSGRETFSPDAAYYVGPTPLRSMRFAEGAPIFAVEVRSEGDYGAAAEIEMAAKRADYFEAGTLVVWDVDPEQETIRSYAVGIETPTLFTVADIADAEPAVPSWRLTVRELFA